MTLRPLLGRALAAVTLALSALTAHAADPLVVEESVQLAASPARVWATIADFKGLAAWHPAVASTEIRSGKDHQVGAVRVVTTKDGAKIVEELLGYDPALRSMRYRIIDSPLPVTDYVATLRVEEAERGARLVWQSEFKRVADAAGVDDAKARALIAGIYVAGFDGVRAVLGEGGPAAK